MPTKYPSESFPSVPILPSHWSQTGVQADAQAQFLVPSEVKAPRRRFPLPTQFLAIQLDPVGMVRSLDLDDEATRAAEELATKAQKYLVAIFIVRLLCRDSVQVSSSPLTVMLLIGAGRPLR